MTAHYQVHECWLVNEISHARKVHTWREQWHWALAAWARALLRRQGPIGIRRRRAARRRGVAIWLRAVAVGLRAVAVWRRTIAVGLRAVAVGLRAVAIGLGAVAIRCWAGSRDWSIAWCWAVAIGCRAGHGGCDTATSRRGAIRRNCRTCVGILLFRHMQLLIA